jgi:hypothetical protein
MPRRRPPVHGLTVAETDQRADRLDQAVVAALHTVADRVAAMVARPLVAAAPAGPPASSYVSVDDLGVIAVLWDEQVHSALLPQLAETYGASAGELAAQLGDRTGNPIPPVSSLEAGDYLDQATNRLSGIGDDLWTNARAQLLEGFNAGESVDELAARVAGAAGVTEARARVIARTEVVSASNAGSIATARVSGFDMTKTWLATLDPRTRETHRVADGQTVGIDAPFQVGGFGLDFPGDPSGPASEVINCRCTLTYDIPDDPEPIDTPPVDTTMVQPEPAAAEEALPKAGDLIDGYRSYDPGVVDATETALRGVYEGEYAGLSVRLHTIEGSYTYGEAITVSGTIHDPAGKQVGFVSRVIGRDGDDKVFAEHEFLELSESQQGSGFARAFNAHLERWYKASGVDRIEIHAALDVGGYAWARAGYDWSDPGKGMAMVQSRMALATRSFQADLDKLMQLLGQGETTDPETGAPIEDAIAALQEQLAAGQGLLDRIRGGDVPTPFEVSVVGRRAGMGRDDRWMGKDILLGSNWYGVKWLR